MNKLKRPTADFTAVPNELLRDVELTMKAKGLYCIMFSKPDGWIFYNDCLVRESCDGKDAVRAAMNELTSSGWVSRTGGGQGPNGIFQPYQYELMLHRGGKTAAVKPLRENRSGKPASSNTDKNNTEEQTHCGRFEEFWSAYPNKVAKPKCAAFWKRFRLDDKADIILASLKRWKACGQWQTARFIPHPYTFLNQERWKDASPESEPKRGEVRVRNTSEAEREDARLRAEFFKLAGLPENKRKSEGEIWAEVLARG